MGDRRKIENSFTDLLDAIVLNEECADSISDIGSSESRNNLKSKFNESFESNGYNKNLKIGPLDTPSTKLNEKVVSLSNIYVPSNHSLIDGQTNTRLSNTPETELRENELAHVELGFENLISLNQKSRSQLDDNECQRENKSTMIELQNKEIPAEGNKESDKKVKEIQQTNCVVCHHIEDSVEFMDPDTVCGIGKFRPQWLQQYATARTYLVLYSIVGVLQGSYFTYLIGTMTTLEKRYAFKSKISGSIMMIDEITPLLLGILVGYFGGKMHRPRVLAVGMYMTSLCCFLSALPYFLYGPAQHLVSVAIKNETGLEYCDLTVKPQNCDEEDRPPTMSAVACLFIGSFCKGFGSLAYYAVGLSYMDDNTKRKNTPLYFAVAEALRLTGPILGFLMSSAFLKYYEDPFGDPGYGPDDPRWIGAWWMGFVLQGSLLAIVTCPILLFPRRLPKQRSRALSNTQDFDRETNMQRVLGLLTAMKRLLTNPLYIMFTLGTIFSVIGGYGLYIMLPKYMEIQFRLSASDASLLSGPPALVGSQIAIILGGWVLWKWQLTAKQLIAGQAFVELVWAVGMVALIFPSCQHFGMSGTKMTENGLLDVNNECNTDCLCSTSSFSPVCGPDGISSYFSPCHAGCAVQSTVTNTTISNCTCIYNPDGTLNGSDLDVHKGLCEAEGCWEQARLYMICFPLLCSITSVLSVAHLMMLLRCIEPQDKSIALGMFEAALSALAFIPHPIIYGALADAACLVWDNSCGETGNCWYYDIDKFKYLMHGSSGAFAFAATICFSILYPMSSKVRDLYEGDEEGESIRRRASKKFDQPSLKS